MARLPQGGWSAPAEILIAGLAGGFLAGFEVVDMLIVLNTDEALKTFMSSGSLQLGGNLSLSIGPVGRQGEAAASINANGYFSAMYSYSQSRGLYGGISIEGSALQYFDRKNQETYGPNVKPRDILTGKCKPPTYATRLLGTIEMITGWSSRGVRGQDFGDFVYDHDADAIDGDRDPFGDMDARTYNADVFDDLDAELQRPPDVPAARKPRARPAAADPFADQENRYADEFGSDDEPSGGRSKLASYAPGVRDYDDQKLPASSADDYNLGDELVVARYDFEAQQPDDLSFRHGDIIRVLASTESQDGWWRGEITRGGRVSEGVFPANYCERV